MRDAPSPGPHLSPRRSEPAFRSAATRRRFCSPRLVAANDRPLTSQRWKKRERAPALRNMAFRQCPSCVRFPATGIPGDHIKRQKMKPLIFALCVVCAFGGLSAQTPVWQPSPGHTQVPIWPGAVPDAQPVAGPEDTATVKDPLVAGRPWVQVGHVSRPTMTVYAPKEKNTGAAVVVFPGGGYQILAIDLEGTEVCDWLTSRGITCVLLK